MFTIKRVNKISDANWRVNAVLTENVNRAYTATVKFSDGKFVVSMVSNQDYADDSIDTVKETEFMRATDTVVALTRATAVELMKTNQIRIDANHVIHLVK